MNTMLSKSQLPLSYMASNAFLATLPLLFLGGCSLFGKSNVPEPDYEVVARPKEKIEIRRYEPMILARTTVESDSFEKGGSKGFRPLFDYISGENSARQEISMTAPVFQNSGDGSNASSSEGGEEIPMTAPVFQQRDGATQWTTSFVLPPSFTMETTPVPTNPDVKIVQQPARYMAVLRFSGRRTDERYAKHVAILDDWLSKNASYRAISEPSYAGYNPPFTLPMFKRHEILIEVEPVEK